jgi:NO-binding membrane sensor protein with MHYT domain
MTGYYDTWLVILSFVVASLASYVALDLVSRVAASATPKSRAYWLVGGSLSMGLGIWSMHFIGMLAFRLPIPMSYDIATTLLSLLIAVLVSGFALIRSATVL